MELMAGNGYKVDEWSGGLRCHRNGEVVMVQPVYSGGFYLEIDGEGIFFDTADQVAFRLGGPSVISRKGDDSRDAA